MALSRPNPNNKRPRTPEWYSQSLAVFFVKDLSPHQGCCGRDKTDGGGARRHRGERGGCRPKFWLENDESEKTDLIIFFFFVLRNISYK